MSGQSNTPKSDSENFLLGIPVEVVVELGRKKTMLIREVASLKQGED